MPIRSSVSGSAPVSWRLLLNRVFGAERWSVLGTYIHADMGLRPSAPKFYLVSVPRVTGLLLVQEWPDHGFTLYLESPEFDIDQLTAAVAAWASRKD